MAISHVQVTRMTPKLAPILHVYTSRQREDIQPQLIHRTKAYLNGGSSVTTGLESSLGRNSTGHEFATIITRLTRPVILFL
ncbi:hypothetical protein TNCV_2230861 [Trichonephila clavipes]|uniref:Uncharacterized protein n=1 Tax=Trichonephila clavipes TaxID=2585209 RepID=A0A8X7BJY1_TRICX|nr:hypothetical protein TNCV_2230861 [Trichonephila clavipes]